MKVGSATVHHLRAFEEKPNPSRAEQLLEQPGVAWNGGIFLWTRRAILLALHRYTTLTDALDGARDTVSLRAVYADLPSISIDYAVLEPAARDGSVVMTAMSAGWSDLGGWPSLLAALGGPSIGRVVRPGETVTPGPSDLVLRRDDGRLEILSGEAEAVSSRAPMAHFPDGLAFRQLLTDLVDRVMRQAAGR